RRARDAAPLLEALVVGTLFREWTRSPLGRAHPPAGGLCLGHPRGEMETLPHRPIAVRALCRFRLCARLLLCGAGRGLRLLLLAAPGLCGRARGGTGARPARVVACGGGGPAGSGGGRGLADPG